jgi:hypothetical protein
MDDNIENQKKPNPDKTDRIKNKLETISTLILAFTSVAIAWCTYQAALWGGIQTFRLSDMNKFNRAAQQKRILAEQARTFDEAVVINFVNAALEKNQVRVNYYLQNVDPDLSKIMSAWLALNPFETKPAYPHPMEMPEYKQLEQKNMGDAEKLISQADAAEKSAQEANTISDNYGLLTVVFSLVMFLSAIESRINRLRINISLIVTAGLICIAVLVVVFFYMPIARE